MKILLIGGTGRISTAITKQLAMDKNNELWILNRGTHNNDLPEDVHVITCDINDESQAKNALMGMKFDVVCDFIGFVPEQVERDYRLFNNCTKQYIYISSASAYQNL